jgi:hypothetical protein
MVWDYNGPRISVTSAMLNLSGPKSHNDSDSAKITARKVSDETTINLISFNDSISAKSFHSVAALSVRYAISSSLALLTVGEYVRHY